MRLLVITPTLGTSATLSETIATVAAGGGDHLHLLVAPAKSESSLRACAPHLRLVTEAHPGGMYSALNTGLTAAAGESWDWFTYLNDDDLWIPAGLRTALAVASQGTADVIYGRVRLIRESGTPTGELPVARRPQDLSALLSRGIVPFAQPGMLFRRSLVDRLNGFDASYRAAGDLDLCIRALNARAAFAYVPHVVATFRLRRAQLSKDAAVVTMERARALASLPPASPRAQAIADLRFRVANLGVYLDRLRRHGWKRMDDIYRKA